MPLVNDIHSGLNETEVAGVVEGASLESIRALLDKTREEGRTVSIAGGRHAMGGQQFASGAALIDTRSLRRVLAFDAERGFVEVEAGIQWPDLIDRLLEIQPGQARWGIAQKQTGADRFTIGGSLSANGHGRGLTMQPLVADVESFRLLCADGSLLECSRDEHADLFGLALGGYGLFGLISSVTLRLAPRRKLERVVELLTIPDLASAFEERIASGFLYGDFQFAINPGSADFLHKGIFSCYRPCDPDIPILPTQRALSREEWKALIVLAHTDKERAFAEYARHYLATSGQIYWSDLHQLGDYEDGYHGALDRHLGAPDPASEVIGELYVPRALLADFMGAAAADFRRHSVDVIYGTIRLVERDSDTVLAWATEDYACIIFNLHTVHTAVGIAHTAAAFRRLIDLAIERQGSYFLTYHRFATEQQVDACYPTFRHFLSLKRQHDPEGLFQSDWYRHYAGMFGS